jgi:hypothetical protein
VFLTEMPSTPQRKSRPTDSIFGDHIKSPKPNRKRTAENMTPDWLQKRFHYLEDRLLSIGHTGPEMDKAVRQYENHLAKMRELGVEVPKSSL